MIPWPPNCEACGLVLLFYNLSLKTFFCCVYYNRVIWLTLWRHNYTRLVVALWLWPQTIKMVHHDLVQSLEQQNSLNLEWTGFDQRDSFGASSSLESWHVRGSKSNQIFKVVTINLQTMLWKPTGWLSLMMNARYLSSQTILSGSYSYSINSPQQMFFTLILAWQKA